METRYLESLLAVAECGSIAESARRLNLTPAAVKQRIGVLEEQIGARLLQRSGQVMQLTEAGVAILERARSVVDAVRELPLLAAGNDLRGELRLFAIQTALSGLIPDILARLARDHPQIEVRILRGNSLDAYQRVFAGEVDAALTSEPSFEVPKAFNWSVVRDEPYVVLTPADVRERDPIRALEQHPFIRLDRNVYAGRTIDGYLRRARIAVKERFELDGLEAIAVMVDRGLGVSLLPDWAPPWPEGLTLRKLPLPDPTLRRKTGLLWPRSSQRGTLIAAFLATARATQAIRKAP
jgi:DNA-binding transcriptional LysR family regulator